LRTKVVISVINDLVTDQRVKRTVSTFSELNYDVTLVGRKLSDSLPLYSIPNVHFKRFSFWINKGVLFYTVYQIRLFFYLLFKKADMLYANDLDTLLPNFLIARIRGIPLIYDSHEYFLGVPELEHNLFAKRVWHTLEKIIFPRLKSIITVNASIAALYENEYGKKPVVVRNIPMKESPSDFDIHSWKRKVGIPEGPKLFILQGSGININRGAEEAIEAMQWVDAVLLIVGGGDVFNQLPELIDTLKLKDKVFLIPKMPREQLLALTAMCYAGLTLDKDSNINYRYSLPNKLFDYIYAHIPVIASNLPEVASIVNSHQLGIVIMPYRVSAIADAMNQLLQDQTRYRQLKNNCKAASSMFDWQQEKLHLVEVIHSARSFNSN
jgi:glycosyltransferase involved in cell wall biosynthesis